MNFFYTYLHTTSILADCIPRTAVPKISLKIPQPDIKPDMKAEPLNSIAGPSNHSFHASGSTGYDVTGLPAIYSLNVPEERAKNTWVFSETKREVSGLRFDGTMIGKRKREKGKFCLSLLRHESYMKMSERSYGEEGIGRVSIGEMRCCSNSG